MNKPYFTKYIPVEGEIKEGDMFEYIWRDNPHYAKYDRAFPEFKGEKKVKLFLCSRDIQVGDTIQHPSGEKGIFEDRIADALHLSTDSAGHYSSMNQWFKVIGEVSPNALTFVKENMKFAEDEWDNALPEPYAHFKCPTCFTFH